MRRIQQITIDSSDAVTELCVLGKVNHTDKTPYNDYPGAHRHPYTAVYSLLFSQYKYRPVRFVEIGIAAGSSVRMWRSFFQGEPSPIYAFDRDQNFIDHLLQFRLPGVFAGLMDVSNQDSVRSALAATGGDLDIVLDDSSHTLSDQIKIIHAAIPFVKPGGMIVIEDVFRNASEETYETELADVLDQFSLAMFITTEHVNRYSPGWDNDKLLVLIKK
jgi:predicted O-methyltransferase YrrM